MQPQEWSRVLSKYREPVALRSITELVVTIVPFVGLWALAWWAVSISPWLALAIAVVNSLFLLRIFVIQHDCGHGSFFRNRQLGDWIGRGLGVLTLTPYDVWRKSHAIHHASSGNLDRRGTGDIPTLTVREYLAKSWMGRTYYRLYRSPIVLFVIGPFYTFFLVHRVPFGFMSGGIAPWASVMATNLAIGAVLTTIYLLGGLEVLLLIFLPTTLLAATIGVWLFYVQHQFEDTTWDSEDEWNVLDAALHGSSHYVLPEPLRWFSANIGAHHIHHLASRIPFYRIPEILKEHAQLAEYRRLTMMESLRCARLHLWDEERRKLISFSELRSAAA